MASSGGPRPRLAPARHSGCPRHIPACQSPSVSREQRFRLLNSAPPIVDKLDSPPGAACRDSAYSLASKPPSIGLPPNLRLELSAPSSKEAVDLWTLKHCAAAQARFVRPGDHHTATWMCVRRVSRWVHTPAGERQSSMRYPSDDRGRAPRSAQRRVRW